MDEIFFFEGNNKNKIIKNIPTNYSYIKTIEINYHSGGIEAPYILLQKYEKIFEEYISKGECFKDSFDYKEKKYFFIVKKIKK